MIKAYIQQQDAANPRGPPAQARYDAPPPRFQPPTYVNKAQPQQGMFDKWAAANQPQEVKQPSYARRPNPVIAPSPQKQGGDPIAALKADLAMDNANKRLVFKSVHDRINIMLYTSLRINRTLLALTSLMIESIRQLDPRVVGRQLDEIVQLLSVVGRGSGAPEAVVQKVHSVNAEFLRRLQAHHRESLVQVEKELHVVFAGEKARFGRSMNTL